MYSPWLAQPPFLHRVHVLSLTVNVAIFSCHKQTGLCCSTRAKADAAHAAGLQHWHGKLLHEFHLPCCCCARQLELLTHNKRNEHGILLFFSRTATCHLLKCVHTAVCLTQSPSHNSLRQHAPWLNDKLRYTHVTFAAYFSTLLSPIS